MKVDDNKVFDEAISTYGEQMQCLIAMEEMSELQKEVSKYVRGIGNKDALTEEIADVEIMLAQLRIMCGIEDEDIASWHNFKVERLAKRLKEEKET